MNSKYLVNGLFILCYSMFLMFMSACYNELETVDFEEQEEQQSVSIEDGMCIIQSLGFDTLDVVELKSGYLIQGDIYLEKSKLVTYSQPQTRQAYHTTGLIGHPKHKEQLPLVLIARYLHQVWMIGEMKYRKPSICGILLVTLK